MTRNLLAGVVLFAALPAMAADKPVQVTVGNFIRAESDLYFGRRVKLGGLGKLHHARQMTPIALGSGLPRRLSEGE